MSAVVGMSVHKEEGRELPDGWRWVQLGEICDANPRRAAIKRDDSSPTSFIPMECVEAISGTVSDLRVRPYGEIKKGYTFFSERDVLFAKITPCMQNGKHVIARNLIDGIGFGSTEFHVLRPGGNVISEIIWFYLRQPTLLTEATEHFTGTVGQQRLPQDYLTSLKIPLPPLSEQKRIAALLNKQMEAVNKARTAAEARLEAIKALPAALLRRVFPKTDKPLPDGWRLVRLGEVCNIILGQSPPGSTYRVEPEGLPFFQGKADFGKINPIANVWCVKPKKIAQPGDILISVRAPVGPTNIANIECCIGRGLAAIRSRKDTDRDFILNSLRHFEEILVGKGSGSTFQAINRDNLASFKVPLPPFAEQQRIAVALKKQMDAVEKARTVAEAELQTIKILPEAFMRWAFGG